MDEVSKILYTLDKKGSIRYFRLIARPIENGAVLITQKGILGMTETEDIKPIYPKNVGRANETSPFSQARLELNSKVNKLLDKGYKDLGPESRVSLFTVSELRDYLTRLRGTDANNLPLPMLAQKTTYLSKKAVFPGYVQRKFDGVRALAQEVEGKVILRSRKGKEFKYLNHIIEDLPKLKPGWFFDGELYSHQLSLQQIVSRVKREQEENNLIRYRVYDLGGTGLPYKERKKILSRLLKKAGPSIERVRTYKVNSLEEITELFSRFVEEGYEGAMYRNPGYLYEQGERSFGLIKVKGFMEEEFEIIGGKEAEGRDAGTVIFTCRTSEGVIFDVRPMGSRELRAEYWNNLKDLIGEKLTVRFQNYTPDGTPFHARGIVIRNYE